MKLISFNAVRIGVIGLAALAGWAVGRAEGEGVQSPGKRRETIERSKNFLAQRNVAPITVDPFHSEAFSQMVSGASRPPSTSPTPETTPVGPRSEKDLLQSIAMSLKPSGFFILGGQPTLVFGQKRVKSGSTLTIAFEGTEYTLEIVSVDRTNFTLRLNREEFTRPNK